MRTAVVLPAPFGPSRPEHCPPGSQIDPRQRGGRPELFDQALGLKRVCHASESAATRTQAPRRLLAGCSQAAHPGTRPARCDDVTAHQRAPGDRGWREGARPRQPFGIKPIHNGCLRLSPARRETRRPVSPVPVARWRVRVTRRVAQRGSHGAGNTAFHGRAGRNGGQRKPEAPGARGHSPKAVQGGPWAVGANLAAVHLVPRRENQAGTSVEICCFVVVGCLPG